MKKIILMAALLAASLMPVVFAASVLGNSFVRWDNPATPIKNLSVDAGTLFVDSSADRVGVGTTSPLFSLVVNKDASRIVNNHPTAGSYATFDVSRLGARRGGFGTGGGDENVTNFYTATGAAGAESETNVFTISPAGTALRVNENASFAKNLSIDSGNFSYNADRDSISLGTPLSAAAQFQRRLNIFSQDGNGINLFASGSTTEFPLVINTKDNSANYFVIRGDGNAGFGPSGFAQGVTLGVVGNVSISTNLSVETSLLLVDSNRNKVFRGTTTDQTGYEFIDTGDQYTTGNIYVTGDVSALTFTDRTPFYEGDALAEINRIRGKDGEIDHSTLPAFVRTRRVVDGELVENRDIGAMVSVLTVAVQQLAAKDKAQQAEINRQARQIKEMAERLDRLEGGKK